MSLVDLQMPHDVVKEAGLSNDAPRGSASVMSIILDGLTLAETLTTAAAVAAQLPALAQAIRNWVRRQERPAVLKLKGPNYEATISLGPNVGRDKIIAAITNLLEADQVEPRR